MTYIFAVSILANTFAVTGMMIVLGLAGHPGLAADFGIVHGATVALLHSFSGNARSIVLNTKSPISTETVLTTRLLLILPLGLLSWLLSVHIASVGAALAAFLVLRRCAEWIAEVQINHAERVGNQGFALRFTVGQSVLSVIAVLALATEFPYKEPVLLAWGTSPIWLSPGFLAKHATWAALKMRGVFLLLPHFGSSAIIGIAVYVFRLLILLLAGKTIAGELYSAFAIGGLLGSVFVQAIGPTLVQREAQGKTLPAWVGAMLGAISISGLLIVLLATLNPGIVAASGLSSNFLIGAGCSLVGGVVMVLAQRIKLRLLNANSAPDVFGPDVLTNILIVAAVPYAFFLAGPGSLATLYLLNALLALLFFWSAERGEALWTGRLKSWSGALQCSIVFLLIVPLFFKLDGSIFRYPDYNYDTGGSIRQLPVPVSVLACYAGLMLFGSYSRARVSLVALFATFALMLVSTVMLVSGKGTQEQAKLILLIQFVLPMFALVLGQVFDPQRKAESLFAEVCLKVLVVIIPLQLLCTWAQGRLVITPYLYAFSVHQHLQYVPSVLVGVYLIALFTLWQNQQRRAMLLVTGLLMSLYVAATVSTLAIGTLAIGLAAFAWTRGVRNEGRRELMVMIPLAVILAVTYFSMASGKTAFVEKFTLAEMDTANGIAAPLNVKERVDYWTFYGRAIVENPKAMMVGHESPPDRIKNPSAHNYYLDFIYNFGLVSLLPLLILMAITLKGLVANHRELMTGGFLAGLSFVVMFLVLIDNNLKVGMRQPYPGIFTFFLWGLLLSRLTPKNQPSHERGATS
ncbi:MAG: hypothetical protein ACO1PN_11380 [Betaproteobacteria bacterium]